MTDLPELADLGWSADLQRQRMPSEELAIPARVTGVHRSRIEALSATGPLDLTPASSLNTSEVAVGDWLLAQDGVALRVLDRQTALYRKAAGSAQARQLIAANVTCALITTSCNADFNPARLERYLVLCAQAAITPVLVLTKADTCAEPEAYATQARALQGGLAVVALNAKDAAAVRAALSTWCRKGQTVVLLGSSGVGKTTLSNALTGGAQAVQGIREDDAKGRHTTTARSLVAMAGGGWLIDTPGVRELQLADMAEGIDALFDDLTDLAATCRFSDCRHDSEPGCAIRAAVKAGQLDPARLTRWQKLLREDRVNSESLQQAQKRAKANSRPNRMANQRRSPLPSAQDDD